jgi:hypothetical protein
MSTTRHGRGGDGIVLIEGERYELIPYGSEVDFDGKPMFSSPCHICCTPPGGLHGAACTLGAGRPYRLRERCRDCGVAVGEIHVLTCSIEQCPRCLGQYMSCACVGEEDGPAKPRDE